VTHHGVVRVGTRYGVFERLTGGVYRARPAVRTGGRVHTYYLEGPLADIAPRAVLYPTVQLAVREAERANRRAYDPEGDRWAHLDLTA
jgi:hypothetical protein